MRKRHSGPEKARKVGTTHTGPGRATLSWSPCSQNCPPRCYTRSKGRRGPRGGWLGTEDRTTGPVGRHSAVPWMLSPRLAINCTFTRCDGEWKPLTVTKPEVRP